MPSPLTLAPTLGQTFGNLDVPDPPALPSPPFIQHWLFENPWPLVLVLAAAAGLCWFIMAPRRGPRNAASSAGPLAAIAFVLLATSHFVTTQREALIGQSVALVHSVAAADTAAVDHTLAPDAVLVSSLDVSGLPRDQILLRVGRDFAKGGPYEIKDHAVLSADAAIESATFARAQLKVRVTPTVTAAPAFSWWRLDYRRQPDGSWKVTGLQPLSISGVSNPTGR